MKSPKKPLYLFIFVTNPHILLAVYFIAGYAAALNAKLLIVTAFSLVLNVAFTVYAMVKRREGELKERIFPAILSAYAVNLVLAVLLLEDTAYLAGFISPRLLGMLACIISMAYGMTGLTAALSEGKENIVKYITGIIAVPFVWFLGFNILSGVNLDTVAMILIAACAFFLIFLLARTIMLWKKNKEYFALIPKGNSKLTALYAIFSLSLPLCGLILNLYIGGALGDFAHPAFFIIPVVNGVLLLTRPFQDKRLRLIRFFLISAATVYFLYFFIVFIPYIPIGFIGLIVIAGALVFAPAGALVMQIIHIVKEWPEMASQWGAIRVAAVFAAGLLVLPACVLTSFIGDRENLSNAAAYLEQNAYAVEKPVDLYRLKRTLKHVNEAFEPEDELLGFGISRNTPLISDIYAQMVLDKKVISQENIRELNTLFFRETDDYSDIWDFGDGFSDGYNDGLTLFDNEISSVSLADVRCETQYDAKAGATRTWVNLTLEGSSSDGNQEYVTTFTLPEGAYISNYYLDVAGTRKYGILADERAALLVYRDIVGSSQDPGVLHYINDRKAELRVFPFSAYEKRYTGFEILHNQNTAISIDGRNIELKAASAPEEVKLNGAALITPACKARLPEAQKRNANYCFIVDCSYGSDVDYEVSRVEAYADKNGITSGKVIFASYNAREYALADIQKAGTEAQCGFNLGLAVKKILMENGEESVPVILFVSENAPAAIFPKHVSQLAKKFPESGCYYALNPDMSLTPYRFISNEKQSPVNAPIIGKALDYNGHPVKDDNESEIVITGTLPEQFSASGSQYADALLLDVLLKNDPSMDKNTSLRMLRASFETGILTQQTAFTVVETEIQESELLQAQKEFLTEDKKLAMETLDEPQLVICIPLALLIFGMAAIIKRRKARLDGKG